MAELIPKGSVVLEFGAGRRQTEKWLDAGCTYIPSDVVSRGPDTIVLDLNSSTLPDLTSLGIHFVLFGGVLL